VLKCLDHGGLQGSHVVYCTDIPSRKDCFIKISSRLKEESHLSLSAMATGGIIGLADGMLTKRHLRLSRLTTLSSLFQPFDRESVKNLNDIDMCRSYR
jgi:hypothetical protein